ncbi:hypothetical protein [Meiothermus granaticius]|uniref:Lipopolysaccharide export system protein LptA n=1 Tax=Meiothermus granaticius NBRC 107808 TaxID=1227551 RepID=A0A399F599_9DEIN|nr:hypothetical protein [Meiothermus granaticius]RIH91240.1 hypothetical protein Mgrana_02857 [Meiothermus granaticius NBRC 107808]GEM86529.1 hypothetical protein MGR01S_11540 [Meiothermus granaticius NBRC 107808]
MKRVCAALLLASLALAARFVGFEVKPNGNSELDATTGVYTLNTGGTITDNKSGLSLVAKYIQYKDGEFIRAREARLRSRDGEFIAQSLEYQQKPDTLRMEVVRYSSSTFKEITARQGLLLGENVLVLKGQIRSSSPSLEAETVVVDADKNQALVLGNFTYKDAGATLRGQKANSTLLLSFNGGKVQASTKVPTNLLQRLQGYADRL